MKRKQCTYTKRDSSKCTSFAMNGSDFCYRHNPKIPKEAKLKASSKGGKTASKDEFIESPLPEIKIEKIQDVVTLLADTVNNMRTGKISHKSGTSIGYVSFILLMAIRQAKEEKEQEKIDELKAEGKWRPEPEYVPKYYRYKDDFYLDKDGNPLIVEKDGTERYPQIEFEPEDDVESVQDSRKTRSKRKSEFYPDRSAVKETDEDSDETTEDIIEEVGDDLVNSS